MNDADKGCPRCSDYDKVKQELESNKSQREKETKDALKQCKDSKARLQKKLLTLGAIAVVAGTLLGKDFVDTIASYIKSFNDVKDNATKLISSADAPVVEVAKNEEKPEETKEEEKDESPPKRDWSTALGLSPLLPVRDFPTDMSAGMSFAEIIAMTSLANTSSQNIFTPTYDEMPLLVSAQRIDDLTAFSQTMDMQIPYETYEDMGMYQTMQTPYETPAIVPSPSTLSLLLLGNALSSNRSRRP